MSEQNGTNGNGNKRLMPSNATSIGVASGAGAGPIVVWLLGLWTHTVIPPEVGAAIGSVVGHLTGYFFEGGRKP